MTDGDRVRIEGIAKTVLDGNGGAAKLSALSRAGVSGSQAAALTRRGVLDRPRNGWYVDPELPWEGEHAIRVGGVLDRVSAASSFGLPVREGSSRRIHVLVASDLADCVPLEWWIAALDAARHVPRDGGPEGVLAEIETALKA